MRIWVIEIGEPLPVESDVRLLRYGLLTRKFASSGHEVIWWTSSFSHASKRNVCPSDGDIFIDGVTLRVIKGPGYRKNISFQRIIHQRNFAQRFDQLAGRFPVPDIFICTIPTIESAYKAIQYGLKNNVPVLVDIRDEWPDEIVDLAPSFLRPMVRLLLHQYYTKMKYICSHASGVVAMSERQLKYGLSFSQRSRGPLDGVFPHGYSPDKPAKEKLESAFAWWKEFGVRDDAFLCCFFGTIGRFFNFETVIRAAEILGKEMDIQFVICGDGSSLEKYRLMASHLDFVLFPGWIDAPKISALMEMSDVGLAPYSAGTKMSLPNKVFEYLSGRLPVVSSIQGEMKDLIDQYGCGLTYDPDSVEDLYKAVKTLYECEDLRFGMGECAYKLFEQKYSLDTICKDFNEHLIKVKNVYGKR